MHVTNPFFSIIIPTCQRHETLFHSIKTVLQQNFKNYELIISDNHSTDDTKKVVDTFKDPRIKYIKTKQRISMAENWEFAVSHAIGEYIIIIGDDDGLINKSLNYLYNIIYQTKFTAIRWERVYYSWPNLPIKEYANELKIPLTNKKLCVIDGVEKVLEANHTSFDYTNLPMLYNSAISSRLISELKDQTGTVFSAGSPDIYSGIAFALISKKYLSLSKPISINGGSACSNGMLAMNFPFFSDTAFNINQKNYIKHHKNSPFIRSIDAAILDCLCHFQDKINYKIGIDYVRILKKIIKNSIVYNDDEKKFTYDQILSCSKHIGNIYDEIQDYLKNNPIEITIPNHRPFKTGYDGRFLTLNANHFKVHNVFEVSRFVSNFLDYDSI